MARISCPHCRHTMDSRLSACPSCGKPMAVGTAAQAHKYLEAAELFGGLVYCTGLVWMALDPARPLAAVIAAALGGAAFLAGRLFRER